MADAVDHCTGWLEGYWSACCAIHDGSYATQVNRHVADQGLFACVANTLPTIAAGHPVITTVLTLASTAIAGGMFLAVRIFGRRYYDRGR